MLKRVILTLMVSGRTGMEITEASIRQNQLKKTSILQQIERRKNEQLALDAKIEKLKQALKHVRTAHNYANQAFSEFSKIKIDVNWRGKSCKATKKGEYSDALKRLKKFRNSVENSEKEILAELKRAQSESWRLMQILNGLDEQVGKLSRTIERDWKVFTNGQNQC